MAVAERALAPTDSPLASARGATDTGDRVFHALVVLAAAVTPVLLVGIIVLLALDAWPAMQRFGFGFLTDSTWDPVAEKFGAAAYAYGTVITSVLALLIAGPIGVACAIFIAEYSPRWLAEPVSFLIQLLAAIPSIIYGLWGFFILAPIMRGAVEPALKATLGNIPVIGGLFAGPAVGRDLLVAGVVLSIMILPTIEHCSSNGAFSAAHITCKILTWFRGTPYLPLCLQTHIFKPSSRVHSSRQQARFLVQ